MVFYYLEGWGFITGFAIGYYVKRVEAVIDPRLKKRIILGFVGAAALGLALGVLWFLLSPSSAGEGRLIDCFLYFFTMILPGWAMGMLVEWLVGKYVR